MKKIGAGFIVCLAVLFVATWTEGKSTGMTAEKDEWLAMVNAVERTGARLQWMSVHHGQSFDVFRDAAGLRQAGRRISRHLQLPKETASFTQDGERSTYEHHFHNEAGTGFIRLIGMEKNGRIESYLVVYAKWSSGGSERWIAHTERLKKQLRQARILPQFNTGLRASFNGILNKGLQKEVIAFILSHMNATVVEKMQDETVQSVSAYSTDIKNAIRTKGIKMNLQVATHADSNRNQTRLTIGKPIITEEY